MAEASEKTTGTGNKAVPHGDHDRVAMLSLRPDGVPDQHNPEIIGEREFARDATREQFRQQAVSAADTAARGATADNGAERVDQDPSIAELQQKHEKVADAAASAADRAVDALYTGETQPVDEPAGEPKSTTGSAGRRADSSKTSR